MSFRLSRTLSDRPVHEADIVHFLNRELIPLVKELLRRLTAAPVTFGWVAGASTIDVSQGSEFIGDELTTNSTLTLTGGWEGAEGYVYVRQDGTGGRTLTVLAEGRTVLREDPSVDSNPTATANAITRYRFSYVTIDSTPYVVFERLALL